MTECRQLAQQPVQQSTHLFPSLLCFLITILSATLAGHAEAEATEIVRPKVSAEQIAREATIADTKIRFITPAEYEEFISTGSRLVFYGTTWCKHCKRLSPRWLKLQTTLDKTLASTKSDFKLAKLDCTEHEEFCASRHADAFPTIYIYRNGELYEEYTGELKVKTMAAYVREKIDYFAWKSGKDQHHEL